MPKSKDKKTGQIINSIGKHWAGLLLSFFAPIYP